jgi:hypothetical protein
MLGNAAARKTILALLKTCEPLEDFDVRPAAASQSAAILFVKISLSVTEKLGPLPDVMKSVGIDLCPYRIQWYGPHARSLMGVLEGRLLLLP